ncbi:MAG: phosphatidate cytidylyltransferase [Candidatus Accumulibacter sp.]|jgi:phosphatidate cytidylyltransferase|nr:phosphatidate cytidylyltransferase [Accumulibacter sp.]
MLKARIITAICLLAVFFCALFLFPPIAWLGFSTLIAMSAFWEWGGLMKFGGRVRLAVSLGAAAAIVFMASAFPAAFGLGEGSSNANAWQVGRWLYLPAAAFWLGAVPLWLKRRWSAAYPPLGMLSGALVILPAWAALVQLRLLGAGQLLAVMAMIWLADVAAYFCGRAFGRHKLAPAISPGKTWEGAVGGVLAVAVCGSLFASLLPGGLSGNPGLFTVLLVALAAISIVGDLFESLLKRQAGLKDSGRLLPGHGGVLDRIDSLASTLPLVALLRFGMGL